MPIYECDILLPGGSVIKDYVFARGEDELWKLAEAKGGTLLKARALREVGSPSKTPLNARNLSTAFLQIGKLLDAGLTLTEAIRVAASQFAPPLGAILDDVHSKVSEGRVDFATALEEHPEIPRPVIGAIRAGQESGRLRFVLKDVGESLGKVAHFRNLVVSALTYPVLILSFAVLVALGMVVFVVPGMVSGLEAVVGEGTPLPLPTRILIGTSHFLTSPLGIVTAIALLLGGPLYLRTLWRAEGEARRTMERFLLSAPLLSGLYAMSQMAGLARLLATTLTSGITLPVSLRLASEATSSLLYREALEDIRQKVEGGVLLSTALLQYPHLFSTLFRAMVVVGERSGDVGNMLREVQKIYEEDYEFRLKSLASTLEPIMLIFVGAVVGGIMVAMLLPYFSALGRLQGF